MKKELYPNILFRWVDLGSLHRRRHPHRCCNSICSRHYFLFQIFAEFVLKCCLLPVIFVSQSPNWFRNEQPRKQQIVCKWIVSVSECCCTLNQITNRRKKTQEKPTNDNDNETETNRERERETKSSACTGKHFDGKWTWKSRRLMLKTCESDINKNQINMKCGFEYAKQPTHKFVCARCV